MLVPVYTTFNDIIMKMVFVFMYYVLRTTNKRNVYISVITETCKKTKSKILLDTEYCHKYYECSGETQHKTCTYPKLFSEESYSCEDFKKVKCGSRKERKNYCT